jgi:hypothetical protein
MSKTDEKASKLLDAMEDESVLETAKNVCRESGHEPLADELEKRFGRHQ